MPIKPIVLQRRHAELGRIRLGQKNPDKGFPMKLDRFRFTSVSETYIRDLATLYGGEPRPWDNSGVASWEVITTASSIPVIAVKGGMSQWMEFWSGGGCIHRCDGETNVLTGEPCDHDEQITVRVRRKDIQVNPHAEAKPTTRLSVMLPELEAIGVWRMESHGWNAAAEIPAVAELAQFVGELVPARLVLQERRSVRDGETSRFVVPVLDLQIGAAKLREVVAAKMDGAVALEGGSSSGPAPAALEAGSSTTPLPTLQDIASAPTVEALGRMYEALSAAGAVTPEIDRAGQARNAELSAPAAQPVPDADGVYEGEVVEDPPAPAGGDDGGPDADAVWAQCVQLAASRGLTSTSQLQADAATFLGISAGEASAEELGMYLTELRNRPEVAA